MQSKRSDIRTNTSIERTARGIPVPLSLTKRVQKYPNPKLSRNKILLINELGFKKTLWSIAYQLKSFPAPQRLIVLVRAVGEEQALSDSSDGILLPFESKKNAE